MRAGEREREGYRERERGGGYYRGRSRSPVGYRRGGGGGREYERGRRSPDRFGRDDRERSPHRVGGEDSGQPLSFKHFMARQPDNVRPKEAEVMYKAYLIKQLGNSKSVWFKEHCETEEMRSKYDPVRIEEALKAREAEAKSSAGEFLGMSPSDAGDETMVGEDQTLEHSRAAWVPARASKDFNLLYKLLTKLDEEKNIQKNPVFGDIGTADEAEALAEDAKNGMLDKLLQYAWKVHGLDYYGAKELGFNEFKVRKDGTYTRRGPKPDDLGGAEQELEGAGKFFKDLELKWDTRVFEGDQAFKLVGKERLEKEIAQYTETQVQCIDGNKFMCKLCTKLFKGSDFTRKHISNKHSEILEQIRGKILQDIYEENFLSDETFTEHEKEYKELQASLDAGQTFASPGLEAVRQPPRPHQRRAYFDLDQPKQESRSVLDYGDI
ncbi:C2H2-type domain-containing protein [Chloropicon primus]|uniref:C2H2-type domain-containing protein n=1 Tax=Chloropicon primus TaxID=1764295 RepID=A0A5B8MLD6_9CHLO|nr:hypothetical protein A3770_05p38240 [Chloropicon primus]UPR00522.1 C2H2-type domain-containing protein [Chloropicon primus]|eukprot:QDZ21306.1 hypothetical protein A3770_05p38240 [Chloropicon primus]